MIPINRTCRNAIPLLLMTISIIGCATTSGKESETSRVFDSYGRSFSNGDIFGMVYGTVLLPLNIIAGVASDIVPDTVFQAATAAVAVGGSAYIASQMPKQTASYHLQHEYSSRSAADTSSEISTSTHSSSSNSYGSSNSYFVESEKTTESNPLYGGHKTESNINYCLTYDRNLREKKIRNICHFDISVKDGCVGQTAGNYTQAKADYPYKGVYYLPSSGSYNIKAMDGTYDVDSDICENNNGRVVRTACRIGQSPYFTSALGFSSICIVD